MAITELLTTNPLKKILPLLVMMVATCSSAQLPEEEINYNNKSVNDERTLRHFMAILQKYNPKNKFGNQECENAAERVGDYYLAKQDYRRAIAYYDSANNKYKHKSIYCGDAFYFDLIPRVYKKARCYAALHLPDTAITLLTPFLVNNITWEYFDDTMIGFYSQTLRSVYPGDAIQQQLDQAIAGLRYEVEYADTTGGRSLSLYIYCGLTLFNTVLTLGYVNTPPVDGAIPPRATRDFFIQRFRESLVYRLFRH